MPVFHVELWPDLRAGECPSVDIEADDDLRAAALGLHYFKSVGTGLPVDGTLQVGGETYIFDEVFHWLENDDEGIEFAKANGLTGLTFW